MGQLLEGASVAIGHAAQTGPMDDGLCTLVPTTPVSLLLHAGCRDVTSARNQITVWTRVCHSDLGTSVERGRSESEGRGVDVCASPWGNDA